MVPLRLMVSLSALGLNVLADERRQSISDIKLPDKSMPLGLTPSFS